MVLQVTAMRCSVKHRIRVSVCTIMLQSCVMMVLSLRKILEFLGWKQMSPTIIKEDNLGCIAVSRDPMLHSRTKHMQIKQSFLRDYQDKGEIKLEWVESAEQLADIFTKPLSRPTFEYLRGKIMCNTAILLDA